MELTYKIRMAANNAFVVSCNCKLAINNKMKNKFVTLIMLSLCIVQWSVAQNDWENEHVFEKNKLNARVPSYSYLNANDRNNFV